MRAGRLIVGPDMLRQFSQVLFPGGEVRLVRPIAYDANKGEVHFQVEGDSLPEAGWAGTLAEVEISGAGKKGVKTRVAQAGKRSAA